MCTWLSGTPQKEHKKVLKFVLFNDLQPSIPFGKDSTFTHVQFCPSDQGGVCRLHTLDDDSAGHG